MLRWRLEHFMRASQIFRVPTLERWQQMSRSCIRLERIWKPTVPLEVDFVLAQVTTSDFYTFSFEFGRLPLGTGASPVRVRRLVDSGRAGRRKRLAHLCVIVPFELITRCHGTVLDRNGVSASGAGRCFRATPTCRGRSATVLLAILRVQLVFQ